MEAYKINFCDQLEQSDTDGYLYLKDDVDPVVADLRARLEAAERERDDHKLILEAAASMAGKDWLWCQLAIAEHLSEDILGDHVGWLRAEFEALRAAKGERG